MSYFKNLIHIKAGEGSCSDGAKQKISASRVLDFLVLIYGFLLYLYIYQNSPFYPDCIDLQ